MARMKRGGADEPQAGDFEENNAENYAARAIAFGKRKGYQPGEWPVIRPGQPEWHEWFSYFERIGHDFAKPCSFASTLAVMTVPARSPDEFEPGWQSRDQAEFRTERRERHVKPLEMLTPEERAASRERVGKMLERVKREINLAALNADARRSRHRGGPSSEAAE